MSVKHLNQETFQKTISQEALPVLVDFWAPWCGPCKMLGPVIEELGDELDGKAVICKVDTDENQALAMEFGIMSIPTVVIFKDGKEVNRLVGLHSKANLIKALNL